jgi:hypothetical protein
MCHMLWALVIVWMCMCENRGWGHGARHGYLVEFEQIEIIIDVYRVLLKHHFAEEGVRHK